MDALAATFSDFKLLKSRKICQLHFEIPLERAKEALDLLGMPNPHQEQWVGIAPLAAKPGDGTTTDRQKSEQHRLVKLAAVLCGEAKFRAFLIRYFNIPGWAADTPEAAAQTLREHLGIASRRELATNPDAAAKFEALVARYKQETGQMAEARP